MSESVAVIMLDKQFEENWMHLHDEHCPACGRGGTVYAYMDEETGAHPNRRICVQCGCKYSLCGAHFINQNGAFEHRRLLALRQAAEASGKYDPSVA